MLNRFNSALFNPHTFVLVRASSGERIENIKGQCASSQKVIIRDLSLGIAIGDLLIQQLPGDQEKRMVVTDVNPFNYKEMGAWYDLKVEPESPRRPRGVTTFNVENYGNIGQVGQNNVINNSPNVFEELRQELLSHAPQLANIHDLLKALADLEMEKDHASHGFKEKFARLMSTGANAMTIISPFISRLL